MRRPASTPSNLAEEGHVQSGRARSVPVASNDPLGPGNKEAPATKAADAAGAQSSPGSFQVQSRSPVGEKGRSFSASPFESRAGTYLEQEGDLPQAPGTTTPSCAQATPKFTRLTSWSNDSPFDFQPLVEQAMEVYPDALAAAQAAACYADLAAAAARAAVRMGYASTSCPSQLGDHAASDAGSDKQEEIVQGGVPSEDVEQAEPLVDSPTGATITETGADQAITIKPPPEANLACSSDPVVEDDAGPQPLAYSQGSLL